MVGTELYLSLTESNFTYPVRLVNGSALSSGRVEVYIHGHLNCHKCKV